MMDTDSMKHLQKEETLLGQIVPEKTEKRGKNASKNLSAYFRESVAKSRLDLQIYKKKCLSFLPRDIQYDEFGIFAHNLVVKMTRNTKDYQFIDVQAKWGFFRFKKITILTINTVSPLHDHQFYSGGNFSTVYSFRYKGIPLVCKCFEKPKEFVEDCEQNILKNAIEQYCILKLASHLKVGPKVYDTIGYDIVVYFDCIEFSMEMCEQYSPKLHYRQDLKADLLENLARLHSLHIIHHDIKFDNICYSRQFNRFVFLDYGFSRVVQEQVGFLTLTNYKGSLSHCSPEMVELFHSNLEKEIDLYDNDMNALRVSLLEFEDRSEGMDFADLAEKGIDKIQESPYINRHFWLYFLKYSLYQLELSPLYQQYSSLQEQIIEELLSFITKMFYSHKLKDICDLLISKLDCRQFDKIQPNIFRLNYSKINRMEGNQENQQAETEIFKMLRSINSKQNMDYFLFKYEKQADYLLKRYKNIDFLGKVPFDQQCHFLAKVIEINSTYAKLSELDSICEIVLKNRSFFVEFDEKIRFLEVPGKHLMEVSLILFKKSIQKKFIGFFYDIFLWVVNNVIILKLLSYEQLIDYYESMLKINLRFEEKARVILKFNTTLAWIPMMTSNWPQYATFSAKINWLIYKYSPFLLKQLTQQQSNILEFVLQRQQTFQQRKKLQSTLSLFSSKSLFYQIRMWETYKKIFNYQYSQQNQETLQSYQCEIQFSNYFICDYHHCMILVYYLQKKEFITLSKCLERLQSVLMFRQNYANSFISLIKSMFKLRQGNYQGIELFLIEIQQLKLNGNPAISILIKRQLEYVRYKNPLKFNKCSLISRKAIFDMQLQAISNVFRYMSRSDFESHYLYAINRVIKESLLKEEYFLHFGISMIHSNFFVDLQHNYHQLVKEISILRERQSIQTINYYIFLILFLLVALLVNKSKHHQALCLANYLIAVFSSIKSDTLDKKDILQFVFRYVLQPISQKDPSIKAKCSHLFFEYYDIINNLHCEEHYFDTIAIFADTLQMLYRFRKEAIVPLINNLSKKLQMHDNKFNTDRYFDIIQLIFYRNRDSPAFIQVNSQIYKCLQLRNNHYNIIIFYHIFTMMNKQQLEKWTRSISFRMFQAVQHSNLCIKVRIIQNLYIYQIFNMLKKLAEGKKTMLIKRFVRVNKKAEICITEQELIKLFVRKQSLKLLKYPVNAQKYRCLKRAFSNFTNSIENNQTNWRSKIICSFNNFQIAFKRAK